MYAPNGATQTSPGIRGKGWGYGEAEFVTERNKHGFR